jgi:hypothetical protein
MNAYFNVRPRYSAGSPAMVDEKTARRVAVEEQQAHQHAKEGFYGAEQQYQAEHDPLLGIAEFVTERADTWIVEDLITGDRYVRLFEKNGESSIHKARRAVRLARKYGLPLENEVKSRHELRLRA